MAKTEIDSKAAEAANEEQVKETETQAEAEAVKEKDDDSVVEKDLALNQGEMLLHKRRREKKRKKDFSPKRRIRKMSRSRS
mgnify:CR=1 FL=1